MHLAAILFSFSLSGCFSLESPEDDPAETDATVDTAVPVAPVLSDPTAAWEHYPNIGQVIEVCVTYEDHQEDLAGGYLSLEAFQDGDSVYTTEAPFSEGSSVWIEEDNQRVYAVLHEVESGPTYDIDVSVTDEEEHTSNTVTATVQ